MTVRVESVHGRHLLLGVILTRDKLLPGQRWAPTTGADREVRISRVDGDWITYAWEECGEACSNVKDWFGFQCRYSLVLDGEAIPRELRA